ncbi:MAG: cytochrome c biogenesis protein CcdA [Niabella sp.]
MNIRIFFSLFLLALCAPFIAPAQDGPFVKFDVSAERSGKDKAKLLIKARIKPGIQLYDFVNNPDSAIGSTIVFDSSLAAHKSNNLTAQSTPVSAFDSSVGAHLNYFTDSATWVQELAIKDNDSLPIAKGKITAFYKSGDEFLTNEEEFKTAIKALSGADNTTAEGGGQNQSLMMIFLLAFGGGLLALLTPCVYSMIPVTVSFFTKRSKTKAEGIRNAVWYALSIIAIFTLLGFAVTLIFGPAALNNLATNWIANLFFFAVFLIFGISFLGAFEISLPSSWANKSDAKAGTGSFLGIFFMALTLVLVSFSCTGPIIGNLIVLAAKGNYWGPLVGMFGFSLALALPFALFAFFPSKLNVLGKAGGWLNAVKVTLGFLELALALKFLSNADLAKGWRIMDREVFISLWIVIFALLGIYLLGKLKFHHDDELPKNDFGVPYISIPRLLLALTSMAFAVYMIPGLWGAPLKVISGFVPPMGTQDFISTGGKSATKHGAATKIEAESGELPHPVKYYEQMHIYEPEVVTTYGMTTYFDYNEALEVARRLKKPLMIDFTGVNCPNCRLMEGQVWSDPEVMKTLKEDFVIASLYVDKHIDLLPEEEYYSEALGKKVTTLGDRNADMQVSVFGTNSQPNYFFLDANEKRLLPTGIGYDPDIKKFLDKLNTVKEKYKQGL